MIPLGWPHLAAETTAAGHTQGLVVHHGFGVAMRSGARPLPFNGLRIPMRHTDTKTSEVDLQGICQAQREGVRQARDHPSNDS